MSMSVNIHLKGAKDLEIKSYLTKNGEFNPSYAVIKLQSDKIDVAMFAEEEEIDILIKQLQSIKRKFNKENAKKVFDNTTL